MKNNPLIIRQFYHASYPEYCHLFIKHDDGRSACKVSENLFDWKDGANTQFTRQFQLELVYD